MSYLEAFYFLPRYNICQNLTGQYCVNQET